MSLFSKFEFESFYGYILPLSSSSRFQKSAELVILGITRPISFQESLAVYMCTKLCAWVTTQSEILYIYIYVFIFFMNTSRSSERSSIVACRSSLVACLARRLFRSSCFVFLEATVDKRSEGRGKGGPGLASFLCLLLESISFNKSVVACRIKLSA